MHTFTGQWDLQFTIQHGWAPLHEAAESGDVETLQQLIEAHANVNAQTVKVGVFDIPYLVRDLLNGVIIGWWCQIDSYVDNVLLYRMARLCSMLPQSMAIMSLSKCWYQLLPMWTSTCKIRYYEINALPPPFVVSSLSIYCIAPNFCTQFLRIV